MKATTPFALDGVTIRFIGKKMERNLSYEIARRLKAEAITDVWTR